MLPPPLDPNYKVPETTEKEFLYPVGEEDESLLATGEWKDDPIIEEDEAESDEEADEE